MIPRVVGDRRLQVEQFVQHDDGQELALHLDDPRQVGQGLDVAGLGLERFDHVGKGKDVSLLPHRHRHAVENGQGERQANRHAGADAGHRLDLDPAAHGLDVAPHHVHADAAAGNVGHLFGGGEPSLEDQSEDFGIGHLIETCSPFRGPWRGFSGD